MHTPMAQNGGSWVPGKTTDALLLRVTAVAEEGASRSPLGIWMTRNHAALLKAWSGKRLNWERLAAEFSEAGLLSAAEAWAWTDPAAGDPKAIQIRARAAMSAKRTWHRVCSRKGKAPAQVAVVAPQAAVVGGHTPAAGHDPEALLARLGSQVNARGGRKVP